MFRTDLKLLAGLVVGYLQRPKSLNRRQAENEDFGQRNHLHIVIALYGLNRIFVQIFKS